MSWQVRLPGCHNLHPVCRFLRSGSLPAVWSGRSRHSCPGTVRERSRCDRHHNRYLPAASSSLSVKDNSGLRSVPISEYSDNKNQYRRKQRYSRCPHLTSCALPDRMPSRQIRNSPDPWLCLHHSDLCSCYNHNCCSDCCTRRSM